MAWRRGAGSGCRVTPFKDADVEFNATCQSVSKSFPEGENWESTYLSKEIKGIGGLEESAWGWSQGTVWWLKWQGWVIGSAPLGICASCHSYFHISIEITQHTLSSLAKILAQVMHTFPFVSLLGGGRFGRITWKTWCSWKRCRSTKYLFKILLFQTHHRFKSDFVSLLWTNEAFA